MAAAEREEQNCPGHVGGEGLSSVPEKERFSGGSSMHTPVQFSPTVPLYSTHVCPYYHLCIIRYPVRVYPVYQEFGFFRALCITLTWPNH